MRRTRVVGSGVLTVSMAVAGALLPSAARAEADTFGLGNGHNGNKGGAGPTEVINSYAPLTADVAAGATAVTFGGVTGNAAGFADGDLVMIWRATGANAADARVSSGNPTPQKLHDEVNPPQALENGEIGRWEFARIAAGGTATANQLTFTAPLVLGWKANVTQVVKVPEYQNVGLTAAEGFAAAPWAPSGAGFSGGILVFFAQGTVTNDGLLSAPAGFRGGAVDQSAAGVMCTTTDGDPADGFAPKGEGLVATEFGPTKGGRGNRSIGAGGGNCALNGGGGGGNAGKGGRGGAATGAIDRFGLGGTSLEYSMLSRITMGGGGGAGEQKNGLGSAGTAGGGVVFVRARSLAGTGNIRANAANAANSGILGLESDGAGGGGAGGSIVLRLVDSVTNCGAIEARGGKGGDTGLLALGGVWGPGGGGGGGRVLIQAKTVAGACTVTVSGGAPGAGPAANAATSGDPGSNASIGPTGSGFCFSNPQANPQCADPNPVCDTATGVCRTCGGGFGSGSAFSCTTAAEPVCLATGACVICDGDLGSSATAACQVGASPYCQGAGTCGKCASDADCTTGTHPGPVCNTTLGACGTACTSDAQCTANEWCAQMVCVPKTPNGQPLAPVPPVDGMCTMANGTRTCRSGVCDEVDDLCGLRNGSLCAADDAKCRSAICFDADNVCGKPTGEPCTIATECRSNVCTSTVCTGCDDDVDCSRDKICDRLGSRCVFGCRPGAQPSNAGTARGFCPPEHDCVPIDAGVDIGQCVPHPLTPPPDGGTTDGGTDAPPGVIEGGGCSCGTGTLAGGSPIACLGAAISAMMLFLRSRQRKKERR